MISRIYQKFQRITTNQVYFPEIDGIRFLAIMLVILFHTHGYFVQKAPAAFADNPAAYSWLNTFLENGDRGVELFFVLSGFILCLPFAHQYINNGKRVELKKYYLRRVTRLEPPYILALTGIFLLQLATHVRPAAELVPSWLASLVYVHGLVYHHTPLLTVVAWSLEIEIQFYVLAPLFFRLLALPAVLRRVLTGTMICGLVAAQHMSPPSFLSIYGFGQYFLAGILLADVYVSDTAAQLFSGRWVPALAVVLLLVVVYLPIKDPLVPVQVSVASRLLLPFLIALLYGMILKNAVLKKIFSYRLIPIIGGMCYSVYLLHYTIISIAGRFTIRWRVTDYYLVNLLVQIVLLLIPILLISAIFYLYIERPFMSKKWLDKLLGRDKKNEPVNMQS